MKTVTNLSYYNLHFSFAFLSVRFSISEQFNPIGQQNSHTDNIVLEKQELNSGEHMSFAIRWEDLQSALPGTHVSQGNYLSSSMSYKLAEKKEPKSKFELNRTQFYKPFRSYGNFIQC